MTVIVHEPITAPAGSSVSPRRPAWLLSFLMDSIWAISAYLAAYRLRFPVDRLGPFLPNAVSMMPLVVGAQLLTLVALRAYTPRQRTDWLLRIVAGVAVGTASASFIVVVTTGFEGLLWDALVADALLLSIAAVGWRGAWVLQSRARSRAHAHASVDDLVDRAQEMARLSVIVSSMYAYRELLKNLVIKDLKLKYRGSVFGFLWSLANPLLMIVVYTVAFTYILRVSTPNFVFYLMLGLLAWNFFANSAAMSTGAIVDNSGLLKSVLFPRAILPIATVLFNLAQYLLTVAVFFPVMLIMYRVPISPTMMLFPVFLGFQVLFTIGVALVLATSTAFFRDVRHLLEVLLAMMFWTTPILYEFGHVPARLQAFVLLSPMSSFIVAYQKMFFFRQWPDPTVWLVAVVYGLGAFIVGATLFLTFADRFTELV